MHFSELFSVFVKFFFLLTPPFVISVFLSVTKEHSISARKDLAIRTTVALLIISNVLLFCGGWIFQLFGITLNAFKIGTGSILFLTAVALVQGGSSSIKVGDSLRSIAVVPLAIPVTLGPASIGALIVYGGETSSFSHLALTSTAIDFSILSVGLLLWASSLVQKLLGKEGLVVLSKLTGLILAGLSAQLVFDGAAAFF